MVLMRRKSFADPASLPPSASAPALPALPRIGAMPPEHTLRSASSHYLPERRFHGQLPTSRGDAVKLASWMQGELLGLQGLGEGEALNRARAVYSIAFREAARQVGVHCAERGRVLTSIFAAHSLLLDEALGEREAALAAAAAAQAQLAGAREAREAALAQAAAAQAQAHAALEQATAAQAAAAAARVELHVVREAAAREAAQRERDDLERMRDARVEADGAAAAEAAAAEAEAAAAAEAADADAVAAKAAAAAAANDAAANAAEIRHLRNDAATPLPPAPPSPPKAATTAAAEPAAAMSANGSRLLDECLERCRRLPHDAAVQLLLDLLCRDDGLPALGQDERLRACRSLVLSVDEAVRVGGGPRVTDPASLTPHTPIQVRVAWLQQQLGAVAAAERSRLLEDELSVLGGARAALLLGKVLPTIPARQLGSILQPVAALMPAAEWMLLLRELPAAELLGVAAGLLDATAAANWFPLVIDRLAVLPPSAARQMLTSLRAAVEMWEDDAAAPLLEAQHAVRRLSAEVYAAEARATAAEFRVSELEASLAAATDAAPAAAEAAATVRAVTRLRTAIAACHIQARVRGDAVRKKRTGGGRRRALRRDGSSGKAEAPPPNLNLARRGASSGAVRVPSWDTR